LTNNKCVISIINRALDSEIAAGAKQHIEALENEKGFLIKFSNVVIKHNSELIRFMGLAP